MKKCKYCGYETYSDDTYCKKCGKLIVESKLIKEEEVVYDGVVLNDEKDKKYSYSLILLAVFSAIFYLIAFLILNYNLDKNNLDSIIDIVGVILYVASFILAIISLCLDFALFKKAKSKVLPILGILISFIVLGLHSYVIIVNVIEYIQNF